MILTFVFPFSKNQLLVLVSDQGYLDHKSIVFETLTDVDNDNLFTDGYGRIWRKNRTENSSREFVVFDCFAF